MRHLPRNSYFSSERNISVMKDLYKSGNNKTSSFSSLGFSANGKFLATGEYDGDVKVAFSNVDYLLDLNFSRYG